MLSTVAGRGTATLTPLAGSGTFSFSIACSSGKLRAVRDPDIDFTVTCTGSPMTVRLSGADRSSQRLVIHAGSSVVWAINVATG